MVVIEKEFAIRQVSSVPILCDGCGQEDILINPSDQICDALVGASYIYEFQQELALLQRTQALFDRFPDSRHRIKLTREYLDEHPRPEPDLEFEMALNKAADLKEFLRTNGFWLPARLNGVQESLIRWQKELDRDSIQCSSCHEGCYRIEPKFFERLM